MSDVAALEHSGPWTVDDLERLPDDGNRYELIDGSLLVSPAPAPRHQLVARRVGDLLAAVAPSGLEIIEATGSRLSARLEFVPDVLVVHGHAAWSGRSHLLPADVLLAVEIVSPSSVTMDRVTKPALYAAAGIPHYWRIEIDLDQPLVVAHRLTDGVYAVQAEAAGDEPLDLSDPFPIIVVPSDLLRRR